MRHNEISLVQPFNYLEMKKPAVKNTKPLSVDEYIGSFPKETQRLLGELRKVIKAAAPEAEEVISYSMPAVGVNSANYAIVYVVVKTEEICGVLVSKDVVTHKCERIGQLFCLSEKKSKFRWTRKKGSLQYSNN